MRDLLISGAVSLFFSIIGSGITFYIATMKYRTWKEKREEKMTIFKQLMSTRNIRDYERIKAINSIDIIFNDAKKITDACVIYIKAMKDEEANPNDTNKKAVKDGELNLLIAIAEHLKLPTINVNAIVDNSFHPRWLDERRAMDYYMMDKIDEMVKMAEAHGISLNNKEIQNKAHALLCPKCKNKLNSVCDPCKKKLDVFMKEQATGSTKTS